MGRTWTQAPSNLPPHPFFGEGNLALRPRFLQPLCFFCDSIGPYNPDAIAPLFHDRQMGLTPPSQPAACAAHLKFAGLYDPSDTLTTVIYIPGARTPSFVPVASGIYAPTVATSIPFSLEAGWALRTQPSPISTGTFVPHPGLIATSGAHRALYL